VEEEKLEAHSDWVRDVAWAPNVGIPVSTIATCSQVTVMPSVNKLMRTAKVLFLVSTVCLLLYTKSTVYLYFYGSIMSANIHNLRPR